MKKHICIILTLIILVCTIIATFSPSRVHNEIAESESSEKPTTETETINELTAFILDIDLSIGTLMVGESIDSPLEEQIRIILKKNTEFIKYGTALDFHELSVGNQVSITYKGDIVKSDTNRMHYPLQIEIDDTHVKTHIDTAYILSIDFDDDSILIGPSLDTPLEEQTRVFLKKSTQIIINGTPRNHLYLSVGEQISITYIDTTTNDIPAEIHSPVLIEIDNLPPQDPGTLE